YRCLGDFVRFSHASHRYGGQHPRNGFRGLYVSQGRVDVPRTQDVRANATVLQLHGPGSHQIANRGLGRAVGTEGGCAFDARDGADEDDRASVVHQGQGFLHREQRALDVEIEKLVEMLLRQACQGSEFACAGIGDQDIDVSLRLHGLVESIEVLQFGDVPANTCNVAADRLHGLVEFLLAAAGYEDVGTFIDEPLRGS